MEYERDRKEEEEGSGFLIVVWKIGNEEGKEGAPQTFCLELCAHAYISLNIR